MCPYVQHSHQWEKVGEGVGHVFSDCQDRYWNHTANWEVHVTGAWIKEEEEGLTQILAEMTIQQDKDFDNDVFWVIVSNCMANQRETAVPHIMVCQL